MKKSIHLTLYLALITFVFGSVLFTVQKLTQPYIEARTLANKKEALKIVVPKATEFLGIDSQKEFGEQTTYKAIQNGKLIAYVFLVAPVGYDGPINMLVGIANRKITGVTILSQTETPGLGALAVKRNFLDQFNNKKVSDPFHAKKDIHALTGATITSQAVADGIKEAIKIYSALTKN